MYILANKQRVFYKLFDDIVTRDLLLQTRSRQTVVIIHCWAIRVTWVSSTPLTVDGSASAVTLTTRHERNSYSRNPDLFPEGDLALAANYCRNPDEEDAVWCYTMDPSIRFERCNIWRCFENNSTH